MYMLVSSTQLTVVDIKVQTNCLPNLMLLDINNRKVAAYVQGLLVQVCQRPHAHVLLFNMRHLDVHGKGISDAMSSLNV